MFVVDSKGVYIVETNFNIGLFTDLYVESNVKDNFSSVLLVCVCCK